MSEVFFSFRAEVPAPRQEGILLHIRRWSDVQQVSRLVGENPASELYHICVAYLTGDADQNDIVNRLRQLPEIEDAEAPTPRALVL
jgi:hypothetical protein